jgi:hypothetical protein
MMAPACPVDRVAPDSDRRALADAEGGELANRLVGQGAAL